MSRGWRDRAVAGALAASLLVAACASTEATSSPPPASATSSTSPTVMPTTALPATTSSTVAPDVFARPEWLGTRVLDPGPGGFGVVLPTPAELDPRMLRTPLGLPDVADEAFRSVIAEVPPEVLARSTWTPECPVTPDELRYVTVMFWGFDGGHHTGEMLVNAAMATDMVSVFEQLHAARFPIEEMRITAAEELDLPPTGDGNNTSAFVCREVRGGSSFSQHAFGLAIDVNPFHNPYVRGDVVLPELASTYLDRSNVRDGMFLPGSDGVAAFQSIAWTWGGNWAGAATDHMHFSSNGE